MAKGHRNPEKTKAVLKNAMHKWMDHDVVQYASYKGWKNFPRLCMKMLIDFHYFKDTLKCDILRWEYCHTIAHHYKEDRYL